MLRFFTYMHIVILKSEQLCAAFFKRGALCNCVFLSYAYRADIKLDFRLCTGRTISELPSAI